MKHFFIFVFSISMAFGQTNEDWLNLFNGKDLEGWDLKIAGEPLNSNYKNTIRVEDNMIRAVYDDYSSFDAKYGHLFYNKPFSHYILDYEYRFTGNQTPGGELWNNRNSGVMFHSQSAQSMSYDQGFPVSLEMQLLGGLNDGAKRTTGNLCTPGTFVFMGDSLRMEHCINSDSKTYFGDQWVKARLIALGDSIVHQIIEGDTVLTYHNVRVGGGFVGDNLNWDNGGFSTEDKNYWISVQDTPLKSGYIALQAESHPIDFKNIRLLNLKGCMNKNAKNYKSYYLENDETACKF